MYSSIDFAELQQLSVSACLRCRKQKILPQLKCSREKPICRRCHRIGAECSYPAPPDRRRLAAERAEARSKSSFGHEARGPLSETPGPSSSGPPDHADTEHLHSHQDNRISSPNTSHEPPSPPILFLETSSTDDFTSMQPPDAVQLSQEVAMFLIDVYFDRHYQAHLLFNKKDFTANFLNHKVPKFVLLSVFAFASLFFDSNLTKSPCRNITPITMSGTDWPTVGRQWANQASQMTLMNADKPCLEHVQACQSILCHLKKLDGYIKSAADDIFPAIAHRTCCLLRLDQFEGYASAEDARNARFHGTCWNDLAFCPLPSDSDEFQDDVQGQQICFNARGHLHDRSGAQNPFLLGTYKSMIIIYGIWWEIQDFVQNARPNRLEAQAWISRLYELDKKLQDFYEATSEDVRYVTNASQTAPPTNTFWAFCVTYFYHLCVFYLHSSVVPALSGTSQRPVFSKQFMRLSAEQALQHCTTVTNMTSHFLSTDPDLSKLWAIVGYGASVCLATQLRYFVAIRALDTERLQQAHVHLKLTTGLKRYWAPLRDIASGMERVFSHASLLATPVPRSRMQMEIRIPNPSQDLENLVSKGPAQDIPAGDIYTYVPDEEGTNHPRERHDKRHSYSLATPTMEHTAEAQGGIGGLDDMVGRNQMVLPSHAHNPEHLGMTPLDPESIWWDQDPVALANFPGNTSLLSDIMDLQMEMY
ncbi:hypothetical protein PT974_07724 [Cladobotryum mycophilum]|uniref:Zn(2)-C6 fungal-type domain-containing protein n=1 Tax=Cladobotryum mycophilum TaxID=491253 RepID=A0ABR0SHS8_9HYPO